jgi:hypothetical protein
VAVTLAKTHDHAEYDPTVLTALGTLVADPASGVTPFALDYFSSLGAQWRASGYRPDPDATDAALATVGPGGRHARSGRVGRDHASATRGPGQARLALSRRDRVV